MANSIKSIKIGTLKLDNNVFLAPLEGFTNVALRKNTKIYGPGLVFTEMIPANALRKDRNYCKDFLYKDVLEGPLSYQLGGAVALDFTKSIEKISNDADMININLGCPVEKVIDQRVGCGLYKRKSVLYNCVKKIREEFDLPLTIKIRVGYKKPTHLDYEKLYSYGCDGIIIHARTCNQKYRDGINLDFLREAKEKSPMPVIGNGSIERYSDIKRMYNETNVDGFMVGRAALHNPKVFHDLINKKDYIDWQNTMQRNEKIDFMNNFYTECNNYNLKNPFFKTKSLAMYLFRGLDNSKHLRELIAMSKDINNLNMVVRGD